MRRKRGGTVRIIPLSEGMELQLKKPHPCGGDRFRLLRVGSLCRVVCEKCGRDMEMDRVKLEKAIKSTSAPQAEK